jgi:hypothetical protein
MEFGVEIVGDRRIDCGIVGLGRLADAGERWHHHAANPFVPVLKGPQRQLDDRVVVGVVTLHLAAVVDHSPDRIAPGDRGGAKQMQFAAIDRLQRQQDLTQPRVCRST